MALSPLRGIGRQGLRLRAGIGSAGLRASFGAAPPPPLLFFTDTGGAVSAFPAGLRVRVNGGAWVDPATAGYTGFSIDPITYEWVLTGGPGSVSSLQIHYEQEMGGEPYGVPPVAGIWTLLDGQPAMQNPAAYGIPVASTPATVPVAAQVS